MVLANDKINQLIIDMPPVKNFNNAVAFSTGYNLGEYYKKDDIENLIKNIKKQHKEIVDRISLEMPPIEIQHSEEEEKYIKRLNEEVYNHKRQFDIMNKLAELNIKRSGKTKKQKRKLKKQKSKRKKKY